MKRYAGMCYVIFLAVFFVLALVNSVHSQDVIRLKYTNYAQPMDKASIVAAEWCKELEKRTNGKVKVTYFPGGQLVPAVQAYDGIVNGIADVGVHVQQYSTDRFPLTEVMYLPIGANSARQGTKLINAWYDRFKPKEYNDVKVLYLWVMGPAYFQATKPLNSINDLKGLKIRSGGDIAKIVRAFDAVPVSIPMADSYDGFQRGVIQGTIQSSSVLAGGTRFGDLMKGFLINHGIGAPQALVVVMNKDKWNSLPPDVQKTVEQLSKEWADKTASYMDLADKEGIDYGLSKGMKVVTVSKAEEQKTIQMMKPILDEYVAKMKKLGLPGEESLKFCLDFVKTNP